MLLEIHADLFFFSFIPFQALNIFPVATYTAMGKMFLSWMLIFKCFLKKTQQPEGFDGGGLFQFLDDHRGLWGQEFCVLHSAENCAL